MLIRNHTVPVVHAPTERFCYGPAQAVRDIIQAPSRTATIGQKRPFTPRRGLKTWEIWGFVRPGIDGSNGRFPGSRLERARPWVRGVA